MNQQFLISIYWKVNSIEVAAIQSCNREALLRLHIIASVAARSLTWWQHNPLVPLCLEYRSAPPPRRAQPFSDTSLLSSARSLRQTGTKFWGTLGLSDYEKSIGKQEPSPQGVTKAKIRGRKLTSSYINCRVRADLPTPPLPTMMTLCRAGWTAGFFDMVDLRLSAWQHNNRDGKYLHLQLTGHESRPSILLKQGFPRDWAQAAPVRALHNAEKW